MRVGWVEELHRYPVKSMLGERLSVVDVEARGLAHDRMWATRVANGKLGSGKSTRRFHRIDGLSMARARCEAGTTVITLPDGTEYRADDPQVDGVLSTAFGQPMTLQREASQTHFDDGPVHLVTMASLRSVQEATGVPLDPRRLRANILLEGQTEAKFPEDDWIGCSLRLGSQVVLEVVGSMKRCVMVNNATSEYPRDNGVLKAIAAAHGAKLGVFARVVHGGRVLLGAEVRIANPHKPRS